MPTQREKMLAGELYNPLEPELAALRERARDLCQDLNATREGEQARRREIGTDRPFPPGTYPRLTTGQRAQCPGATSTRGGIC